MTKLHPEWATELLNDWARADWREAQLDLGMPTVCPSFKGLVEINDEVDVTGYSPAEVRAIAAAVEHLHLLHAEHYRALCRHFRPWMRAKMPPKDGDDVRLREAVQMIAKYVDQTLG